MAPQLLALVLIAPALQEGPSCVALPGIENAFRLGPDLYSGAQPEGTAGFAALRELGVRTLISVDGATPDVEAARAAGLRYIHLPIGYDGISEDRAAQLVRAVSDSPGPVFIHCHHGKHRGPAAAALCARAAEGWTPDRARDWLVRAGTSADYAGLYASVDLPLPDAARIDAVEDLPEKSPVPGLVESMVAIDGTWDRLKAIERAGWRPPVDRPDLDPPHEALQLVEHFREAARLPDSLTRGGDFLEMLRAAERRAGDLERSLRSGGPATDLAAASREVGRSCVDCHKRDRDLPEPGPGR